MPPLFNIDANFYGELTPYLGSFWTSKFGQPVQVNILLNLAQLTNQNGAFRSAVANLNGDLETAKLEKFAVIPFDPDSVSKSGQLIYDDPDYAKFYEAGQTDIEAYNDDSVQYFVLPVTTHIPKVLQTPQIKLFLGIDFFAVKERWLFFRQDPRLLFPESQLTAPLAERVKFKPINTFLLRADVRENNQYLTQYYRGKQTPGAFKLALAAVAGLKIIHYDQKLLSVRDYLGTKVYTFEQETIRVEYEHTELIVGQVYSADQIIGDGLQIYYDQGTGDAWWKQIDWGAGISLDPILRSFSGLPLLNQDTIAYGAGSDLGSVNGSKLHARIKLSDDFYGEKVYWDWVAARETNSGYYVNGLIGLPDEPSAFVPQQFGRNYPSLPSLAVTIEDWLNITIVPSTDLDYGLITDTITEFDDYGPLVATALPGTSTIPIFESISNTFELLLAQYAEANALNQQLGWPIEAPDLQSLPDRRIVNALDFFFQAVLQKTGMVIVVDRSQIKNLAFFYRFMQREMLAGVVPVILSHGDDLEIESMAVGTTMIVDDRAVNIMPSTPISLLEAVDLTAIMTDSVTLNV